MWQQVPAEPLGTGMCVEKPLLASPSGGGAWDLKGVGPRGTLGLKSAGTQTALQGCRQKAGGGEG